MWNWVLIFAILFVLGTPTTARDFGQWKETDPAISAWFRNLKQPDTVYMGGGVSCCGEADGYWADEVKYKDGKIIAVITDDRDDNPLVRIHEEPGTEYVVPTNKIVHDQGGNPTGHVIIFLGVAAWDGDKRLPRPVLCYVLNGGV